MSTLMQRNLRVPELGFAERSKYVDFSFFWTGRFVMMLSVSRAESEFLVVFVSLAGTIFVTLSRNREPNIKF